MKQSIPPVGETDMIIRFEAMIGQLKRWRTELSLALAHGEGTHTFDDLVTMILTNRVHFYSWDDCCTVMEHITYPQFTTYHCFLAGGSLEGVLRIIPDMEAVAKHLGCRYLSMAGREGWKRPLTKTGWKPICLTMYLELEDK